MIRLSRLPEEVARLLAPLKPSFSYRHYAVFCWLVVAHLVCFEKATLQGLARSTPSQVAVWHLRRLLAAGRWPWARALELLGADNVMFKTDFPHPTCLYPQVREQVQASLGGLDRSQQRKVLYETAAKVYNLPLPV